MLCKRPVGEQLVKRSWRDALSIGRCFKDPRLLRDQVRENAAVMNAQGGVRVRLNGVSRGLVLLCTHE